MEAKHVELVFLWVVSDSAYLASTNMTFHKATMHLTTEFNCLQCDYTPRDKTFFIYEALLQTCTFSTV